MGMNVAQRMRQLAADGRFGKADFASAAVETLDGRGITKGERGLIARQFQQLRADPQVEVNDKAEAAYQAFMKRTSHYSASKRVYAPTLDKSELQSLLQVRASQLHTSTGSRATSGGEYSGVTTQPASGGEYGGGSTQPPRPTRPTRPAHSGGEYGGGSRVSLTSGGEY